MHEFFNEMYANLYISAINIHCNLINVFLLLLIQVLCFCFLFLVLIFKIDEGFLHIRVKIKNC